MNALANFLTSLAAVAAWQTPVLEIPQRGLDAPDTYRGYTTRFFRDSRRNTFQIYLDSESGRVVHLWADAADASAAFTVQQADGEPARITWGSPGVAVHSDGTTRSVRYRLASKQAALDIGWFLLGSMRQEREFQDQGWHERPYGGGRFILAEFEKLIDTLDRLPSSERERQLLLLRSSSTTDLRARLHSIPTLATDQDEWTVTVEHTSLDDRVHMSIRLQGNLAESEARVSNDMISLRSRTGGSIAFDVILTSDNAALTPLPRNLIFNREFDEFLTREQRAAGANESRPLPPEDSSRAEVLAYCRLERSVAGMELLSTDEKIMAALPNYATYFGRDTMMAALMLERISSASLQEHVIADVLQKLEESGNVSHEEAVGEQAIRENAAEYVALTEKSEEAIETDPETAGKYLTDARALLGNLQSVRENYHMIDDDFQLAVLVDRYLARDDVPNARKSAFLNGVDQNGVRRMDALIGNLALVARLARPYADRPETSNLVGFRQQDDDGYQPGSWRDSRAGYGNGRFAMDVNVIWVPVALESLERILHIQEALGFSVRDHLAQLPEDTTALAFYVDHPEALRAAIETWHQTRRRFEVRLDPETLRQQLETSAASLEGSEREFWQRAIDQFNAEPRPLSFLALALDQNGIAIPLVNTDVAMDLFLRDYTEEVIQGKQDPNLFLQGLEIFVRAYPIGLLVDGVGPVVVNDAYASRAIQQRFRDDSYHSPRAIWGREVNLLLLGLARQIEAAYDPSGKLREESNSMRQYVKALRHVLDVTLKSTEASGMQQNELWSYRIEGGLAHPARFDRSSDIQLWNLTHLAVRFELDKLPPPQPDASPGEPHQ